MNFVKDKDKSIFEKFGACFAWIFITFDFGFIVVLKV